MIAMTGQSPTDIKLSAVFKQDETEASVSINQEFNLAANASYKFNNNLSANICCEIATKNIPRRRNVIKNFGIGITANYESMRSLMEVEEDFSEFELE